MVRSVVVLLLVCWALVALANCQNAAPETPEQQIEKLLGRKLTSAHPQTLQECQAKLSEWKEWADRNWPRIKEHDTQWDAMSTRNEELEYATGQLQAENQRLRKEKLNNVFVAIATFASLGVGVFAAYALGRFLKRVWPSSSAGKQLVVMVVGAFWISAVALLHATNPYYEQHAISLVLTVFVFSIPPLLFCGIAVWWLGKNKAVAETQP